MNEQLYTEELLKEELFYGLRWISSDLAFEYDEYMLFPFRSKKVIRAGIEQYSLTVNALDPGGSDAGMYIALDEMIDFWDAHGEDSKRIMVWLASISEHYDKKVGFSAACSTWRTVFWWWANDPDYKTKHMRQDRFNAFMRLVHKDFIIPKKKLESGTEDAERNWVENKSARSEWDEFLWVQFFEEIWLSPITCFELSIYALMLRQFGKKHLDFLTSEEIQLLYYEAVEQLQQNPDMLYHLKWFMPLDKALDLDGVPDFDKYKRDWPQLLD